MKPSLRILHTNTPAELSKRRTSQRAARILHKRILATLANDGNVPFAAVCGPFLQGANLTLQFLLGQNTDILHMLGKLESEIRMAHLQRGVCRCAVCRNPLTGLTES